MNYEVAYALFIQKCVPRITIMSGPHRLKLKTK